MKFKSVIKKLPLVRLINNYFVLTRKLKLSEKQLALAIEAIEQHQYLALQRGLEDEQNKEYKPVDFGINANQKIIISLTSYGARINTVHLTVLSLLNQSVKPNKVMLWLAEDEFVLAELPQKLLNLQQYGLEIAFCADIRSYKKLIPTLLRYPNKVIVTFDDDIIYPMNQLERLICEHQKYPEAIICNRAHKVSKDKCGEVLPYSQWYLDNDELLPCVELVPIGIGGVLYPINSLHQEVLNQQAFMELCPHADDIWFKVMALKNNTLTKVVDQPMAYINYFHIPNSQENSLWRSNKNKNDQQLGAVLAVYPEVKLCNVDYMTYSNETN